MKPTLVLSGGGMKMTYGAGFMAGLHDQGIKPNFFESIYGTSGGAGIAAYYGAGQMKEVERMFKVHFPKKIIGLTGTDTKYLEQVLRVLEPLNIKALRNCSTSVFAALTNLETSKTQLFKMNSQQDPIQLIVAGASFNKAFIINGEKFLDGGFSSQIPIEQAEAAGAKKIWVIVGEKYGYRLPKSIGLLGFFLPHLPKISKLFFQVPKKHNQLYEKIDQNTNFIVIRPKSDLNVGVRGLSFKMVEKAFETGRQDAYTFVKNNFVGIK